MVEVLIMCCPCSFLYNLLFFIFFTILIPFLTIPVSGISKTASQNKLLVILADGFRPDYFDYDDYPGLRHFAERGVRAKYMEPVFPSNTYPNMYTLVTGLYAENHGMLDNIMVDKAKQDWFLMHPHPNASHEHWWQGAEPVWITATKANRKCAVFWWFGCEVPIRDMQPILCEPPKSIYSWLNFYEEVNRTFEMVAGMFSTNEADLGLIYYEDLDYRGHKYGPDSTEIKVALKKLDDILDNFWRKINSLNLQRKVNVIFISDHGMISTDASSVKYVDLSTSISLANVEIMFGLGSSAGILPVPEKTDEVYAGLQKIKGVQVYKKDDLPERYHIKKGSHLAPINVIADKGYFIKKLYNHITQPILEITPNEEYWKGFHGYDSAYSSEMHAVFYAVGPDFKENVLTNPIKSVDVYNLMCDLLGLTPLPNNGTWDNVNGMLIMDGKTRSKRKEL